MCTLSVCVCLGLAGRQPATCQWEVVYPAQTLAVYTTLFITGTVLLNYHLIYGLAWCSHMYPNEWLSDANTEVLVCVCVYIYFIFVCAHV